MSMRRATIFRAGGVAALALGASALALGAATAKEGAHPDLSGSWDNGGGIGFVHPQHQGQNVCLFGCPASEAAPAPVQASAPRAAPLPPDRPTYTPEAAAKVADLNEHQVKEDPVLRCLPPGVPRLGPPDKVVQTEKEIVFLYEDVSGPFFRVVPLDGRGHRTDIDASPLGDSIGHWEGDTLVVETTKLTGDTWLTDNGAFHTADLRVTERLHRDGDALVWDATAYDPAVLAKPWELRPRRATRAEHEIVVSPPCVERDLAHMQDATHHDNPR
jgi:hypothetical protein